MQTLSASLAVLDAVVLMWRHCNVQVKVTSVNMLVWRGLSRPREEYPASTKQSAYQSSVEIIDKTPMIIKISMI